MTAECDAILYACHYQLSLWQVSLIQNCLLIIIRVCFGGFFVQPLCVMHSVETKWQLSLIQNCLLIIIRVCSGCFFVQPVCDAQRGNQVATEFDTELFARHYQCFFLSSPHEWRPRGN